MRGAARRAGALVAGAALALSGLGGVHGRPLSQLVTQEVFFVETSECDGASCRKQFIGANETFGMGAHDECSKGKSYGHYQKPPSHNLFELVYFCRRDDAAGTLISEEECGIESVCLDTSTDPETSSITYQIAFEFNDDDKTLAYDVSVDMKLYFNYFAVDETLYSLKADISVTCELEEICHRGCAADERLFLTRLKDTVGDGWNAGGINSYDHFRIENRLALESTGGMANEAELEKARIAAYKNTMLDGRTRNIPICLADGEYLYSTDFPTPPASGGPYTVADAAAAAGADARLGVAPTERTWYESTWNFCGEFGTLADVAYLRVIDGVCTVIDSWGQTPQPSITPITGVVETNSPASSRDDDDDDNVGMNNTPAPGVTMEPTPPGGVYNGPTYPPDYMGPTPPPDGGSGEGGNMGPTPSPALLNVGPTAPPASPTTSGGGGYGEPTPTPYHGGYHEPPTPTPYHGGYHEPPTPAPTTPPTPTPTTPAPTNAPIETGSTGSGGRTTLSQGAILGIAMGVLAFAGLAAAGGTYAQHKGWFGAAGAGGAAAAGAAAGAGGSDDEAPPNPDVDEFAP